LYYPILFFNRRGDGDMAAPYGRRDRDPFAAGGGNACQSAILRIRGYFILFQFCSTVGAKFCILLVDNFAGRT
jgi:hypothetical protein